MTLVDDLPRDGSERPAFLFRHPLAIPGSKQRGSRRRWCLELDLTFDPPRARQPSYGGNLVLSIMRAIITCSYSGLGTSTLVGRWYSMPPLNCSDGTTANPTDTPARYAWPRRPPSPLHSKIHTQTHTHGPMPEAHLQSG